MFGIGFTELLLVMLVALLVFGPEQLPDLAKKLGRFMAVLRTNADSLRREFYNALYPPADMPERNIIDDIKKDLLSEPNKNLNCEEKEQANPSDKEESD